MNKVYFEDGTIFLTEKMGDCKNYLNYSINKKFYLGISLKKYQKILNKMIKKGDNWKGLNYSNIIKIDGVIND